MAIRGGLLRLVKTIAYFLAFVSATIITGAFAWYTSHHASGRNVATLVLGIATMLYTLTGILLTCCIAGIGFFAFFAILLDIIFIGVMIAVAVINRFPECHLYVATFAFALIAIFCFLVTIVTQVFIRHRRQSEHTFGSKE